MILSSVSRATEKTQLQRQPPPSPTALCGSSPTEFYHLMDACPQFVFRGLWVRGLWLDGGVGHIFLRPMMVVGDGVRPWWWLDKSPGWRGLDIQILSVLRNIFLPMAVHGVRVCTCQFYMMSMTANTAKFRIEQTSSIRVTAAKKQFLAWDISSSSAYLELTINLWHYRLKSSMVKCCSYFALRWPDTPSST